jgi:outer membrane protein
MMRQILIFAALMFALPAIAGNANLSDVYRLALENDAVYAAARESYKAGLEKAPQARAGLLPTLNLGGNLRYNESRSSGSPSTDYDSRSLFLTLTQPIYRKQNIEAYAQARIQALLSEQQLRQAEQNLLLSVAQAYFAVLQARDVLTTAQVAETGVCRAVGAGAQEFRGRRVNDYRYP